MSWDQEYYQNQWWTGFTFYDNFSGVSEISATLAEGTLTRFDELRVHCSAAHSDEQLTINLVPAKGSGYSWLIASLDMNGLTDLYFMPSQPIEILSDDIITFNLTNSAEGTVTFNVRGWSVKG